MKQINGQELYAYIVSGAKNVIVNEQNLNRINVFPVPDGDTGTNLALTMNSIISQAQRFDHAHQVMAEIAQLSIDNAYGNSGMIFAQYFNGLADSIQAKSSLSPIELVESFKQAALQAVNSVAHPKEGTILTVMREWTKALEGAWEVDYDQIFEKSLHALQDAVSNTKNQLKVLRDNNVVDAGAQAFYFFVEGIVRFLKSGTLEDLEFTAARLDLITEMTPSLDIGDHRYCAQYLIQTKYAQDDLIKSLDHYGDSLVVNQNGEHISIHVHTNEPHVIMRELVRDHRVISHKVDDMWMQAHLIHAKQAKMVIITDSIADLPQQFKDDHHCVVLPLNIIIDSNVYMDKLTMRSSDFYKHMDDYRLNPSSSQASPIAIERILNQVLPHYDEIIGIFVSQKMSGTYQNILKVVNKMNLKDKKIAMIDSKTNSITEGLLVYEALKLRAAGESFEDIVSKVEAMIPRLSIFVSVKDLKYMLKGGRVSKIQGFVLSKLKLQPVISIDQEGKGIIPFKSLTQKSAVKSILKVVKKDMETNGIDKYALVYADDPNDLTEFKASLVKLIGKEPEYIETISPIVGLNAGKGAFAVGYIKKA